MFVKIPKWLYKILDWFDLIEFGYHFANFRVIDLEIRKDRYGHPEDNIYHYKIKYDYDENIYEYSTAIRKFEVGDFINLYWDKYEQTTKGKI